MFADRHDAGKRLAEKLKAYRGTDAIVAALPRGGVVIGYEIARALVLPLDIIAVRKIGHPISIEYAIGAVAPDGTAVYSGAASAVDQAWLAQKTVQEKEEARRRDAAYRGAAQRSAFAGRTVIIADDGIATNLTMRLAVKIARAQRPEKVVVAVPVAPRGSAEELKQEGADEVVILESPERFLGAVGAHYLQFAPVDDAEVIRLLKQMSDAQMTM